MRGCMRYWPTSFVKTFLQSNLTVSNSMAQYRLHKIIIVHLVCKEQKSVQWQWFCFAFLTNFFKKENLVPYFSYFSTIKQMLPIWKIGLYKICFIKKVIWHFIRLQQQCLHWKLQLGLCLHLHVCSHGLHMTRGQNLVWDLQNTMPTCSQNFNVYTNFWTSRYFLFIHKYFCHSIYNN